VISDFFIARPVLANVLAILTIVIGTVALFALPIAQYPDVVPPTVQVTTRYPGASARTVVDAVALPIEQQVNGVEGMIYMQSYSASDGTYSLTVTFRIGVDLNQAQVLVQNRVSSALASLPQAVQSQGVVVQKNSTAILQIVTLTSPDARGCRASAMRACSAPASTRCGSGSTRTRCRRAGWCRRTSPMLCTSKASKSPPARSAHRRRLRGRRSNTRSMLPASSAIRASSPT
jgi:hypothetical protein